MIGHEKVLLCTTIHEEGYRLFNIALRTLGPELWVTQGAQLLWIIKYFDNKLKQCMKISFFFWKQNWISTKLVFLLIFSLQFYFSFLLFLWRQDVCQLIRMINHVSIKYFHEILASIFFIILVCFEITYFSRHLPCSIVCVSQYKNLR